MNRAVCELSGPGEKVRIGGDSLVIIAGPCVIESREMCLEIGRVVKDACEAHALGYVFKASFDKANRTSLASPRGPGVADGLGHLRAVRDELGVPATTDVHEPSQAAAAAEAVDLLQIPAFLCRQTDLLTAVGREAGVRNKGVNIKKGQFLSPSEMVGPVGKVRDAGCSSIVLTERGTFFGYNRLVNDFIGLGDMMELDTQCGSPPVCFDATHSAQLPGASTTTGGRRERVPMLAKAAVAAGVDAVFLECHPDPERAASDASTMLKLSEVPSLIATLAAVRKAAIK